MWNIVPAFIRSHGRKLYDSFYCRDFPDKYTLGGACQWTLRTGRLNHESIIYSGGVGHDISFELQLVRMFGCQIFLFDPSAVGIATMRSHSGTPEMKNIHFTPVGLAGSAGKIGCGTGGKHDGLEWIKSGNDRFIACETIEDLMHSNGHRKIDLLKIDIEGFEYEVLNHCIDAQIEIGQICVEFHHFFPEIPRSRTLTTLARLKKSGFSIIHKHICEMTLCRDTG